MILSVSREVDDATAPIAKETEADGDVSIVADAAASTDNADAASDTTTMENEVSEPEEIIEDNELNIDENERKQI